MEIGSIIFAVSFNGTVLKFLVVEVDNAGKPLRGVKIYEAENKAASTVEDISDFICFKTKKEAYLYVRQGMKEEMEANIKMHEDRIKQMDEFIATITD